MEEGLYILLVANRLLAKVVLSFSGILAARVCADHFEDVVLVDPEFTKTLHEGEKTRIMQYKATHRECFLINGVNTQQSMCSLATPCRGWSSPPMATSRSART